MTDAEAARLVDEIHSFVTSPEGMTDAEIIAEVRRILARYA